MNIWPMDRDDLRDNAARHFADKLHVLFGDENVLAVCAERLTDYNTTPIRVECVVVTTGGVVHAEYQTDGGSRSARDGEITFCPWQGVRVTIDDSHGSNWEDPAVKGATIDLGDRRLSLPLHPGNDSLNDRELAVVRAILTHSATK